MTVYIYNPVAVENISGWGCWHSQPVWPRGNIFTLHYDKCPRSVLTALLDCVEHALQLVTAWKARGRDSIISKLLLLGALFGKSNNFPEVLSRGEAIAPPPSSAALATI